MPAPPTAPLTRAAPASDDLSPPPLSAYSAVIERPLFARNRRPLPPQAAAATAGNVNSFVLAGVTVAAKQRIAFILHGTPPAIARLTVGQTIDGWTVREIGDDRVVLRNHTTEFTILLYKDTATPEKP